MNINKVEEFAKQIYGVKVTKNALGNPMYEFTGTELAMFAELIVRECAAFVSETATIETLLGDRLKEHFGVEE